MWCGKKTYLSVREYGRAEEVRVEVSILSLNSLLSTLDGAGSRKRAKGVRRIFGEAGPEEDGG